MSKLFYVIGPSSSGKDTLYKKIMENNNMDLRPVTTYTTRPIRKGEKEGVEYHFVDLLEYDRLKSEGKVIESRVYNTVHGEWKYFTVDDNIYLDKHNYLTIGVLESYVETVKYFGEDRVIPIYIYVEDGERLQRALNREKIQLIPRYKEMCRRFIADLDDFSKEKLEKANIKRKFANYNIDDCLDEILEYINYEAR